LGIWFHVPLVPLVLSHTEVGILAGHRLFRDHGGSWDIGTLLDCLRSLGFRICQLIVFIYSSLSFESLAVFLVRWRDISLGLSLTIRGSS